MHSSLISKILANQKSKINYKIRLYLILKNKHYFIYNGTVKGGFGQNLKISKNRQSVLDSFSKMAFLFDEVIRLRIVGYGNNPKSMELLYLLNLIPVNRKIRTFLDWKVFSPEYTRKMSRLFEVRNDLVHCISIDEVCYKPSKSILLSNSKGFQRFKLDMENAWKNLLQIYLNEQEKINMKKLEEELQN